MKKLAITFLIAVLALSVFALVACNNTPTVDPDLGSFSASEYTLFSGDKVQAKGDKVTYHLATAAPGVAVDANTGVVTVDGTVADYAQVVVLAKIDGAVTDMAICTLRTSTTTPTLAFANLSQYIVSGDVASATSTPAYSITYSLKQAYTGININPTSGRITFDAGVADGTQFVVVASAKGATREHTFVAARANYVTATNSVAISEYQVGSDVSFTLDFASNHTAQQAGVLAVMQGNTALDSNHYTYNKNTNTLTVSKQIVAKMPMGENVLKVITAKNSVDVTVKVATYVSTAKELAAINNSIEALAGNYILVCDIDLTEYLGVDGEGYNNGKGWTPIGKYFDVIDGTATDWAFKGTLDGNGHTVKGFFINRSDDFAYNSGFFGYIDSKGVVKNLGVQNAVGQQNHVRSYSGGFAGVNVGTIENCWADVDVITGEAFKVVGGFVGRNEGKIVNCYSLGTVTGGSNVGSFAGVSTTDISDGTETNCYAIQTENYPFSDDYSPQTHPTCGVFAGKAELVANANWSSYQGAWTVTTGALPTLNSIALTYNLRELHITNTQTYVTRADKTLTLTVATNPTDAATNLGLTYKVIQGDGVTVSNGVVNFSQLQPGNNVVIVEVSCTDGGTTLTAQYQFEVFDNARSVEFLPTMETTMYAGKYYYVDAQVLPATANQNVSFALSKTMQGVTYVNGVLAISPYVTDGEIEITATASNNKTATLTVQIVANKTFNGNYAILYRNETPNVTFTLPTGVAQQVTKVTRFDKQIPFVANGDQITLDAQYLTQFDMRSVPLAFITNTATYTATVVAYDKANVVEIGSVADFLTYKQNFLTDEALRSKTVVLTADLDFDGATITSIGSHHVGADFVGVFNGNGHTISNLNIDRNDFSGEYVSEDDGKLKEGEATNPYHASRYNVGLFSYVSGTFTNTHFNNVHVASRFTGNFVTDGGTTLTFDGDAMGSFVGVVAGTVNGIVSDCTFTNCSAAAATNQVGTVCGVTTNTTITNCYVDGKLHV